MTTRLLADAILSLEDAANTIELWAQHQPNLRRKDMIAKADEIRGTIARLERNAQQETSESGERAHGR